MKSLLSLGPQGLPADNDEHKASSRDASDIITPEFLDAVKVDLSRLRSVHDGEKEEVPGCDGIQGTYSGTLNGHEVWAVDADEVMLEYDMDFVVAGNHMRWSWIPENQLWVDRSYNGRDDRHDLLHEATEDHLMHHGWTYDKAHEFANKTEKAYMKATCDDCGESPCECDEKEELLDRPA